MGRALQHAISGDWDPAALAAVPLPEGAPAPGKGVGARFADMPPGARAAFVTGWASLHGVVVLELLGHLGWAGSGGDGVGRTVLLQYADQLDALRAAAG